MNLKKSGRARTLALEAERQLYIEATTRQAHALKSYERNVEEHHPTLVERLTAIIRAIRINVNYVTLLSKDHEKLVSAQNPTVSSEYSCYFFWKVCFLPSHQIVQSISH